MVKILNTCAALERFEWRRDDVYHRPDRLSTLVSSGRLLDKNPRRGADNWHMRKILIPRPSAWRQADAFPPAFYRTSGGTEPEESDTKE